MSANEFFDFNVESTTVRTACLLVSSSILTSSQLHSHDGVSVSEFLDSNVESTLAVS